MHGKDLEGQLLGLARWMIFYGEMHLCSDVPWYFPSGFSLRLPRMNEQPNSPSPLFFGGGWITNGKIECIVKHPSIQKKALPNGSAFLSFLGEGG